MTDRIDPAADLEKENTVELSPVQALGVALSTGPMSAATMGEAQSAAVPMMAHLHSMGFVVLARTRERNPRPRPVVGPSEDRVAWPTPASIVRAIARRFR
jgi:hypothetical protein